MHKFLYVHIIGLVSCWFYTGTENGIQCLSYLTGAVIDVFHLLIYSVNVWSFNHVTFTNSL